MSFMLYNYQIMKQVCRVKETQNWFFYSENSKYSLKSLYTKKLLKLYYMMFPFYFSFCFSLHFVS